MTQQVITFDDWSSGDSGRNRPSPDDPKSFRGLNVWLYPAGIGPRPPWMDFAITGLPLLKLRTFDVFRALDGLIHMCWSFDNGDVYHRQAQFNGEVPALVGTLAHPALDSAVFGNEVYFVSDTGPGGKITTNSGSPATFTQLPDMPTGSLIVNYGQQAVIAIDLGVSTVRWSALNDFATWPAANSLDVGSEQTVNGIFSQRNGLLVARMDGELWLFTGVLGVNETLRKLDTAPRHRALTEAEGGVVTGSNVWWVGINQMVQFTGAQPLIIPRPDIPMLAGYDVVPWDTHGGHVHPLVDTDEFLVVGTMDQITNALYPNPKQVWMHARRPADRWAKPTDQWTRRTADKWTRHIVPVDPYDYVSRSNPDKTIGLGTHVSKITAEGVKVADSCQDGMAYICTTSDTAANGGVVCQVYGMNSQQEEPLVPAGTMVASFIVTPTVNDARSGVPVTGSFTSAEVWHQSGGQYTVLSVLVDYSFNPNFAPASVYNKFDLSVESMQNPGSSAVNQSAVQSFVAPNVSVSTPDGSPTVRGQAQFQMGDQGAGVGFRVRLDNWRGILVHRLTVLVDEQPGLF